MPDVMHSQHPTPRNEGRSWGLQTGGILLANLHQSSRSTFSWESFPSFFAFQEGMLDTQIWHLGVGQQYLGVL